MDYDLREYYLKTTFLNGDIGEEIHMMAPELIREHFAFIENKEPLNEKEKGTSTELKKLVGNKKRALKLM